MQTIRVYFLGTFLAEVSFPQFIPRIELKSQIASLLTANFKPLYGVFILQCLKEESASMKAPTRQDLDSDYMDQLPYMIHKVKNLQDIHVINVVPYIDSETQCEINLGSQPRKYQPRREDYALIGELEFVD